MTPLPRDRVLDVLASLVDKSLVVYEERDGVGRYRLLETVGQYANERLREAGEMEALQERHQSQSLALAEAAWKERQGPEQGRWLDALETNHDNLRAALRRCLSDPDGAQTGVRLVAACQFFWRKRGHLREGLALSRMALDRPDAQTATPPRAAALYGAGVLAGQLGDLEASRALAEESLSSFRAVEDRPGIAMALTALGQTACQQGDFVHARALYTEGLTIRRALGDTAEIANSLLNLGYAAHCEADFAAARRFYEEALALQRAASDFWTVAGTLYQLTLVAREAGDYAAAQAFAVEALALFRQVGEKYIGALVLRELALLAQALRQPLQATRGLGAVEALLESLDVPLPSEYHSADAQALTALRSEMGEVAFGRARQAGRALCWEQAVAEALDWEVREAV